MEAELPTGTYWKDAREQTTAFAGTPWFHVFYSVPAIIIEIVVVYWQSQMTSFDWVVVIASGVVLVIGALLATYGVALAINYFFRAPRRVNAQLHRRFEPLIPEIEKDSADLSAFIFCISPPFLDLSQINESPPYIGFTLRVINSSIFPISILEADGRMQIEGSRPKDSPEVHREVSQLERGKEGRLLLWQFVGDEVAKKVIAASIHRGEVEIAFSELLVLASVSDPNFTGTQPLRIRLPGSLKLKFRPELLAQRTIVRSHDHPKVFALENGLWRGILDDGTFSHLKFERNKIVFADHEAVRQLSKGEDFPIHGFQPHLDPSPVSSL